MVRLVEQGLSIRVRQGISRTTERALVEGSQAELRR